MGIQFSRDPLKAVADLAARAGATQADLLLAVNLHKTRILERTARGVDVDGLPFAPYSERGPFYYKPFGSAKSTAKRFRGKLGAGTVTGGGSLKFPSYGAFKRALGRAAVDLRGARAPHMLQAIVAAVKGPLEAVLGVYGEAAERARGHNAGLPGRLPKRHWFGIGRGDERAISRDLEASIARRLKG